MNEAKPYKYVAYIDEAGDTGLRKVRPIDADGSSEWFTIAAVVIRAENEPEVIEWVREARALVRAHQRRDLHFRDLSLHRRRQVCELVAQKPLRAFVVASNKKNMRRYRNPNAEKIRSQDFFYNWCNRLLLERVTDFACRRSEREGDPNQRVRFEFSERGGFSYGQMLAYHEYMRRKGNNLYKTKNEISWAAMDSELVHRYPHSQRAGLQLADVVASAFYQAADALGPGKWDTAPAELLLPRMATKRGVIAEYGVSLQPTPPSKGKLTAEQQKVFRHYGYRF